MKAPLLLTVFLTGCAEFSAIQSGVATHGAQAADSALEIGKWEVCKAATIGALERDLANDPDRVIAWQIYCGKRIGMHPLLTPLPQIAPQSLIPGRLSIAHERGI